MPRGLATFCIGLQVCTALLIGLADVPSDLAQWIDTDPPEPYSHRWGVANRSEHEWVVTLRDGRPQVRLHKRKDETPAPLPFTIKRGSAEEGLAGRRLSIKVSDGWLVAFNAGEFGAGLWWFS